MDASHTWLVGVDGVSECRACGLARRPDVAGRAWTYATRRDAGRWYPDAAACTPAMRDFVQRTSPRAGGAP